MQVKSSSVLIGLLSASKAYAQNSLSANSSSQSTDEMILGSANKPIISRNYFCDKADLATYATMSDCIPALNALPPDPELRTFDSENFHMSFTNGKCEVLFEIERGASSQSSFLELHLAAMSLATTCQRFREPGDRIWFELRTNGVVRQLGHNGNISIRIGKTGKLPVWPLGQSDEAVWGITGNVGAYDNVTVA